MSTLIKAQQNLLLSINNDCCHILDAIRRLREGTWQLDHEDADWASVLLPQIQEALKDHISFETQCVFPNLTPDSVKKHKAEHEKIAALLWATEASRLIKESDRFHVFLDLLLAVLEEHHDKFNCHLSQSKASTDTYPTRQIIKRSHGSSLEKL